MTRPRFSAVLVEPSVGVSFEVARHLKLCGAVPLTLCSTGRAGLVTCAERSLALIVSADELPDMSAHEMLDELSCARGERTPPTILLSSRFPSAAERHPAVTAYVPRPYPLSALFGAVTLALRTA